MRRREMPELIDGGAVDFARFRDSFLDVRVYNRWFGGAAAVTGPFWGMAVRTTGSLSVLDIGTGSADIPLSLAAQARRKARSVSITALDNHPDVLRVALEATASEPSITVAEGDVMALPFADGAFDFAVCSLTFHHLGPDGAMRAMREMDRVSRRGWVVNDVHRSWLSLLLVAAVTPLFTRNPLTRHDAVASVWRSFTPGELRVIAREAGYPDVVVTTRPMQRVVVVRDKARG